MWRKRAARLGLAERDARRHDLIAENIATLALRKVDHPFLEQRVVILPRPDPYTSNHSGSPLKYDRRLGVCVRRAEPGRCRTTSSRVSLRRDGPRDPRGAARR